MCNHMVHFAFFELTWFVGRFLYLWMSCPNVSSLIIQISYFCTVFCMNDSRIIGQYSLAWVCLAFWVAGMNVNVTCLQALDIYPLARQALICTYFCYHLTDFDTFRTSCLILSIICLYFGFWTSFMSLFWIQGFSNGLSIFGKFEDPSHRVHM